MRREPAIAPDGTGIIARLLEQAARALAPRGSLFVEIAPEQRDAMMRMAGRCFAGAAIDAARDGYGRWRVLSVRQG